MIIITVRLLELRVTLKKNDQLAIDWFLNVLTMLNNLDNF